MKISIEDFSEETLFRVLDRVGFVGQQAGRSPVEAQWVQNPSDQIPPALLTELVQLRGQIEQINAQKQLPHAELAQPSQWVSPVSVEPTIDRQKFTEALARYQTQPSPPEDRSPSISVAATVVEEVPGIEIKGWLRWGPLALLLGAGLLSAGIYQTSFKKPEPSSATSQLQIKPPPVQGKPAKSSNLLPVPYPPAPPGGAPLKLPTAIPRR
ncbi:MAG: hypothetical protein ACRCT2_01825 [Plesiomonas shigelloides]